MMKYLAAVGGLNPVQSGTPRKPCELETRCRCSVAQFVAKQTKQHIVGRGVFGVRLEAGTLEVLDCALCAIGKGGEKRV